MTVEIGMVIQIVIYALALAGLWYTLQNRVNIIQKCMDSLEDKYKKLESNHDKDHKEVNDKIDKTDEDIKQLRKEIVQNKDFLTEKIDGLKDHINSSHLKLLEAINSKK